MFKFIKSVFDFKEQKKQLLHIILLSFIIAFAIARAWSVLIGNSIFIHGYQFHHFFTGMIILSFGAVLGILSVNQKILRIASALIGVGIGLFTDEIGLLLNCTSTFAGIQRVCTYTFPDSFDIVSAIGFVILFVIVIVDVTESIKRDKK